MEYCNVKLTLKAPENQDPSVSFNGKVTFNPDIGRGETWHDNGVLVPSVRVDATIVNNVLQGADGKNLVKLMAGGVGVNPEQVYWRIAFDDIYLGEQRVHIDPFIFEAVPGETLDLEKVTPVAGYTPPGIIRGEKGEIGFSFKGVFHEESELPSSNEKGDAWANLSTKDLYIWNGSKWEVVTDFGKVDVSLENINEYVNQAEQHSLSAKNSETNSKNHEANSLTYAKRAEFAAEETIQQVEGDFATRNYVDGLSDRVYKLEPHSVDEVGETVWAHVTSRGERLPLGYSKDGRLDSHAQKIFQEDIVDTFDVSHSPVYARLTTTPRGDILWGVRWDGTVEIPKLETSTGVGSGDSLATRLVPLAFTLPGGSSTTSGAKSLRIIREYAHFPGRVRVHVSNRHPVSGNAGSDVTLTGSTIGVGAESGEVSKAQVLFSANTVIPAGEEVVSRWVTLSGSDGDGLAVSMAWSGDTVRLFKAGCWTNSDPAAYNNANTTGWAWNSDAPLYIWVEAEMPARVPVVMANGDSISVGSVTDNPVSDSWVAMYARKQHALPVFASWHGSSMPQWAPDTGQWGRLYPGVDVRPDAIVMALGQNDLNQDVDLNELKSRYNTVRDVYDVRFPGVPVYVGTVNASNKPAEKEVIRREFNTWLSSLPRGERGVLDFASVLDDPTGEFLLPEYTADELHPNTDGQTAMAGVVLKNPVTPLVPTGGQIATLGGTPQSSVVYDISDFLAPGTTITAGWGRIMRDANVVTLSIQGLATDKSGVATLFTLPEGFRPINQIVFETVPYWSSETRESGRLTSGGDIQFRALSVGHGMNLSLTYLTDDPQPTS